MPFTIDPQLDEEVYLQREFRGSHDHVFAMAVSNQAVYVSAQKLALKRDPWYFKRIPLNEVEEARLVKQRPVYVLLVGLLMISFGGILSVLMMWRAFNPMPGVAYHVSGWPLAILGRWHHHSFHRTRPKNANSPNAPGKIQMETTARAGQENAGTLLAHSG